MLFNGNRFRPKASSVDVSWSEKIRMSLNNKQKSLCQWPSQNSTPRRQKLEKK